MFGGRATHGPAGGAYSTPSDLLAGFKTGSRDKGRRKGEKGGDRQLREGDRGRREGAGQ